MKKLLLSITILLLTLSFAFAEDESYIENESKLMAISLGPEWNMNSRENFAAGAALGFDFNLGSSFAVGFNLTASSNFSGIAVIEPAAMFRWYFLGKNHNGLFAQAEAGTFLIIEDSEVIPMFLGGLRAGFRLPLGSMFFVEPFGRVGYPFMFGFGAMAGIKF